MRRSRLLAILALVLLALLGVETAAASFVHTDDGCEVELHCVACRWAFSATVLFVDTPTLVASTAVAEDVAAATILLPEDAPRSRPTSRGPPAV